MLRVLIRRTLRLKEPSRLRQFLRELHRVQIGVCGNGDVFNVEDYLLMKKETGCDYVMIGRGAIGNPFIFKQVNHLKS